MSARTRSSHDDARPGAGLDSRRPPGRRSATADPARAHRHPHPGGRRPVRRAEGRALRRQRLPGRRALARRGRGHRAPRARRPPALPGLEVPDTLAALGALAAGWRSQFDLPLVAVTGSNGKTTVTQMIASILRAAGADRALATHGNFNNEIGVPLTLLRLREQPPAGGGRAGHEPSGRDRAAGRDRAPHHRAGQQRAARAPGVHGHGRGGGARERRRVRRAAGQRHGRVPLRRRLHLAVERDGARGRDAALPDLRRAAPMPTSRSAAPNGSTAPGSSRRARPLGEIRSTCASPAATTWSTRWRPSPARWPAACRSRRSPKASPPSSRSRGARGPASCAWRAAAPSRWSTTATTPTPIRCAPPIDVLGGLPGPRLLVLGDMGEVGDQGPQFHAEVGAWAAERGIETAVRARRRIGRTHRRLPAPAAPRRGTSTTSTRSMPRCWRSCRASPACWSRARASCRWSAWSRPSLPLPHNRTTTTRRAGHDPCAAHVRIMLMSLAQWLQTLSPEFGFLRVFQYLTFRALMAALTRAAARPGRRTLRDPPPGRAQDRPAGARLRAWRRT